MIRGKAIVAPHMLVRATLALSLSLVAAGCSDATPPGSDGGRVLDAQSSTTDSLVACSYDVDGDSEIDSRCSGGTDCDDDDALTGAMRSELCGNLRDDNCNGVADEAACTAAPGGSCESPAVVTASTSLTVSTTVSAIAAPTDPSCVLMGRDGHAAALIRVDLAAARSVRVSVGSDADADRAGEQLAVSLRAACESPEDVVCAHTEGVVPHGPISVVAPELAAGSHWLVVFTAMPASVPVRIDIADAITPPSNETCDDAATLTAGSPVATALAAARDDLETSCASVADARDVVYRIEVAETSDVRLSLTTTTADEYAVSLRSTCSDETSELRCASLGGSRGTLLHRSVAPGSYFVVVDGPAGGAFTLELALLPPTTAPPGESCSNPIELVPGERVSGTLRDRTEDTNLICLEGLDARTGDVLYRFELGATSDVDVMLETDGFVRAALAAEVRSTCEDAASLLSVRCMEPYSESVQRARVSALPAGVYFIAVASEAVVDYTISVVARPPAVVTSVSGNERCEGAFVIPPAGGRFRGSAAVDDYSFTRVGCTDDDALPEVDSAFRLNLTERRTVRVNAYGWEDGGLSSIEAGLTIFAGAACAEANLAECIPQPYWSGTLDPGSYVFLAEPSSRPDGRGEPGGGEAVEYVLDVELSAP